jgi:hypothetical protein
LNPDLKTIQFFKSSPNQQKYLFPSPEEKVPEGRMRRRI